jgi:hypothetical protein
LLVARILAQIDVFNGNEIVAGRNFVACFYALHVGGFGDDRDASVGKALQQIVQLGDVVALGLREGLEYIVEGEESLFLSFDEQNTQSGLIRDFLDGPVKIGAHTER